jgi:zinc/manganese transport system permease protein
MFSGFMMNTWLVGSTVAVVAGAVGFFVVLRGSAFMAHALPQCGFAGAAAATLVGASTLLGIGIFSVLSALGIAWSGRRGRNDIVTALALVTMLGLGSLFLSFSSESSAEINSLLFGEILGVSNSELLPTALLAIVSIGAVAVMFRPLLLSSVMGEVAQAQGVNSFAIEACFFVVVALVTTMSVPVVGALLMFSLMIGPPAAARAFTDRPVVAVVLSVLVALLMVWVSIALSYLTNWPVGFFVGTLGAVAYSVGRSWGRWHRRRTIQTGSVPLRLGMQAF